MTANPKWSEIQDQLPTGISLLLPDSASLTYSLP